jgi:hypothetical protein
MKLSARPSRIAAHAQHNMAFATVINIRLYQINIRLYQIFVLSYTAADDSNT